MKKILYLAFVLVGTSVSAQYWVAPFINANENPGALNTDVEQTAAFMVDLGWTTIMNPSTATPTWSAAQTIPFAFEFNGVAETQFVVSSSGVLTFDVAGAGVAPSSTRGTLPSASLPNKSVAVWGVNCAGGNDGITVKTFGTAPNRQMYIMFASVGYGDAASPGGNWAYWSIVLEETTNAIYIADQRTNGFAGINTVSMGVQVDASTAILYNGTSDYTNQAGEDDSPANNTYFAFFPGSQPQFDMSVSEITTPTYVGLGNTNIDGTIKNMGSETITSMTLNYKIDGGAVVSQNVTGLSISSLGSYSFSHGTPWNAVAGAHTVEAYATNLNGANADENTGNDIGTKTINVLEELIQRMPLLEVFTSSTCAPCTPGNANFHSIMDAKPKTDYVAIKFQQNFPGVGDPYHTTEALDRRNTPYAINSIPRMEIDGGWDGNANSYTEQLYLDARAQPAFYKLEGEYKIYEQSFDINVRFSPAVDVSGERLYIALIEDRTDNNIGNNGETEFFDVMKKMVPNVAGTALPNTAIGAWDSLSFNYKFKGDYRLPANGQPANIINHAIEHSVEDFNNVQAIAWVQGTDKTVFQAARLNFVAGTAGTFETAAKMTGVSVSPNPANESMKVEFNTVESEKMTFVVVDMMGNKVQSFVSQSNVGANAVEVNTSKLSTGVYHLMVFDSKNSAHIEKIAVQH